MMRLLKTCFPGITQVSMYISVTESILKIKLALEIWPGTLSGPALSAKALLRAQGKNDLCSNERIS